MQDTELVKQVREERGADAPLITLSGVGKIFDQGAIVALDGIDLSIAEGDCLAILGPSGSGKSTMINMLSGFDVPSCGTVSWKGVPVKTQRHWSKLRSREIGIVFQEFNLLPTLTALENVEMPMFGHGIPAAQRRQRAMEALEKVGLGRRGENLPYQLSGGERQRVAIARSIVNEPKLLLADEPTGNLDRTNSENVADLLFHIGCRDRAALVLVTHNEALALRCPRCVTMMDGRLVAEKMPIA